MTEMRAHSDGASVEWELRDKADITLTIAHPCSLWNWLNWQWCHAGTKGEREQGEGGRECMDEERGRKGKDESWT